MASKPSPPPSSTAVGSGHPGWGHRVTAERRSVPIWPLTHDLKTNRVFPTREEVLAREAGKGVDRGECSRCPGRGSLAIQFQFPRNLSVPHPLSPRHWLLFSSRDVPAATQPMPVHSSSPHVSSREGPLPLDSSPPVCSPRSCQKQLHLLCSLCNCLLPPASSVESKCLSLPSRVF